MNSLIDAACEQMQGMTFPQQRFFTPNTLFWEILTKLSTQFTTIIDCGTGNGELPIEAFEYGIKMLGVDIIIREHTEANNIQYIPAHHLSYSKDHWALICRPDHSGWCEDIQSQALNSNAGFIYIGLLANVKHDISLNISPHKIIPSVGEENESMFIWLPEAI